MPVGACARPARGAGFGSSEDVMEAERGERSKVNKGTAHSTVGWLCECKHHSARPLLLDRGWVKRPAGKAAFYPTAVVSNCKPGKRHALGGSLLSR